MNFVKGKTYKHTGTGEIIYVVAKVRNHFHGCKVLVYESSFSPAEYHYMPLESKQLTFFEACSEKELEKWYSNYRTNFNKTPIYYATRQKEKR